MNHVWQSSAFAILAAMLAFALRRSPAKVRYWIWLSASLKFLVPLTLLVSLGTLLPHSVPRVVPAASPTILKITEPFTPAVDSPLPVQNEASWIAILWAVGFFAVILARGRSWLRIRIVLRAAIPLDLRIPLPAVIAQHATEPGVVGFLRPVLVLPPRLIEALNAQQLGAVLAHEMCHVRRRDNLFAAIHMLVEAIFWFNPLVWWIGSRLLEERERACDEEVLRTGCEPADYVEGILQVCRLYKESPLPCVSGVTGADVKKRLHTILSGSIARDWTAKQKVALATAGLAVLAVPVMLGAATPRFEAASIRPSGPQDPTHFYVSFTGGPGTDDPGLFRCVNASLSLLVTQAYSSTSFQIQAPPWMDDQMFNISAKVPDGATREQFREMLQNLLIDRFGLVVHHESKIQSIYDLVVAENGPKLKPPSQGPKPPLPTGRVGRYRQHETMASLAAYLTSFMKTFVHDATGLNGEYETSLSWVQDDDHGLKDALQEQLGLKLVATKGPVDFLIVDHAEKVPTQN
jgi:uncharacterized protein (TIGR03435 family)